MECSILDTMHGLGKKWAILVFEEIAFSEFDGFNKLITRAPGLTPKILSQRLSELEAAELITRKEPEETSLKVQYELTSKGKELHGVLKQFKEWGTKWNAADSDCSGHTCTSCTIN